MFLRQTVRRSLQLFRLSSLLSTSCNIQSRITAVFPLHFVHTSPIIYKKGRDKVGKNKKKFNVDMDNSVLSVDEVTAQMEEELNSLENTLNKSLTLRTDLRPFEELLVDTPDGRKQLSHIARLTLKTPTMIIINFGAYEAGLKPATVALTKAFNVNPQQQGTTLIVHLTRTTREGRENMAKDAKKFFNEYKTSLNKLYARLLRIVTDKRDLGQSWVDECLNAEQFLKATLHDYQKKGEELMKNKQADLLKEQL